MAIQREDDQIRSYYYYYSGFYNTDRGRFEKASNDFEKALTISQSLDFTDHRLLFQLYYQNGFVQSRLNSNNRSRKNYWLSYDHAQNLKDSICLGVASFGITSMLVEDGNYREAKNFAQQTLAIDLALQDSIAISHDYGILAHIYFKMRFYKDALQAYEQARSFSNRDASLHQYCNLTIALAEVNIALENYVEALQYSEEVENISSSADLIVYNVKSKINKAHAQFELGQKEIAKYALRSALELAKEKKLTREEIKTLHLMGMISKETDQSMHYYKQALHLAKSSNTRAYLDKLYKSMHKKIDEYHDLKFVNSFKNEYIQYLQDVESKNYKSMIDGMDASIKLYTLDELNAKLELENVQTEIKLVNEQQRKIVLYFIIALVVLGFLFSYKNQKQKHKIKELEFSENISLLEKQLAKILINNQDQIDLLPSLEILNSNILGHLTNKEYEIVKNILDRKTNPEIASLHSISINTVKFHLKNIHVKLDTSNKKAVIEKIKLIS